VPDDVGEAFADSTSSRMPVESMMPLSRNDVSSFRRSPSPKRKLSTIKVWTVFTYPLIAVFSCAPVFPITGRKGISSPYFIVKKG
jgi:hypothetical protein